MNNFVLLAEPWWVNLLILVPIVVLVIGLFQKFKLSSNQLFWSAIFGIAFGFIEASVVVYLRAATAINGNISPNQIIDSFTLNLFRIEFLREIFTIIMIGSVAILTTKKRLGKWIAFLWIFAFWDLIYYAALHFTIGWPTNLTDNDVLFLVPTLWLSQVWFPILISSLTIIIIASLKFRK
jgi:hypothetical protein